MSRKSAADVKIETLRAELQRDIAAGYTQVNAIRDRIVIQESLLARLGDAPAPKAKRERKKAPVAPVPMESQAA